MAESKIATAWKINNTAVYTQLDSSCISTKKNLSVFLQYRLVIQE